MASQASHSKSSKLLFGAAKLCQDMASLVNNRQGSDIQFKVGGNIPTQENGETVTLYAHSPILRCRSSYFAAMLDEEKNWKENSSGVIYKPNVSESTLHDVLHYIYTGTIRAKTSEDIAKLIIAAEEMGLEELSTECQNELIRTAKRFFFVEDEENPISVGVAICTDITLALNLASNYFLPYLSQGLHAVLFPRMSVIIKSRDAYTAFTSEISFEALIKIIASDDLELIERDVWDLTLSWACHQTKLSKTLVEARLGSLDDDEKDDKELLDETTISNTQLNDIKKILTLFLPIIRFSLFDLDDYKQIANILMNILSRRRYLEISQFFQNPNCTEELLDTPRKYAMIPSIIAVKYAMWEFLRKNIFETGGITDCPSSKHLKFELLFRASEHGFLASTFHQCCDNKGPTLVIVRSEHGNLFGGVNFNYWEFDYSHFSSVSNFLFALPDGNDRENFAVFRIKDSEVEYSIQNCDEGLGFGDFGKDLFIYSDNDYSSCSKLPHSYDGIGASETALAGSSEFFISDYEVFAISKLQ